MNSITNSISSQLLGYSSPSNIAPVSASEQQVNLLSSLAATPTSSTDAIQTQQAGETISLTALLAASTPTSLIQQTFGGTSSFSAAASLLDSVYAQDTSSIDISA